MKLSEFYQLLLKHDWTYTYSDDRTVYLKGVASEKRLLKISEQSTELRKLYLEYESYVWFNTPKPIIDLSKAFIMLAPQKKSKEVA